MAGTLAGLFSKAASLPVHRPQLCLCQQFLHARGLQSPSGVTGWDGSS